MYEDKLAIEAVPEKRCIMITQKDEEDPSNNLTVKVKFFNATEEEIVESEDMRPKLRMQFKKKRGNLATWYALFKEMQEGVLTNMLVLTEQQQREVDAGVEEGDEQEEQAQEEAGMV